MTPATAVRLLGLVTILAAVVYAASITLGLGVEGSLTAHLLMVFGFLGLYAAQAHRAGTLGVLGAGSGMLGNIFISGFAMVNLASGEGVDVMAVRQSPAYELFADIGRTGLVLGMVLLGVATVRAGVLPRLGGFGLVGAAVPTAVLMWFHPIHVAAHITGVVIVAVPVIWLGWVIWRGRTSRVPLER